MHQLVPWSPLPKKGCLAQLRYLGSSSSDVTDFVDSPNEELLFLRSRWECGGEKVRGVGGLEREGTGIGL